MKLKHELGKVKENCFNDNGNVVLVEQTVYQHHRTIKLKEKFLLFKLKWLQEEVTKLFYFFFKSQQNDQSFFKLTLLMQISYSLTSYISLTCYATKLCFFF